MMKSIAAILPRLGNGSGGLRTVLSLLGGLTRRGCECHVYVEGTATETELQADLLKYYDCNWVIPHTGWKLRKEHDLVLATMWHTALTVAAMPGNHKKAYLVQDYEPFFYPMGSHNLLAEFSYAQNLEVITMGRWLAEKLRQDFKINARPLDFCADNRIYRPRPEGVAGELAVAAIYQPEKPHRAMHSCMQALWQVQQVIPQLKVYTFGSVRGPSGLNGSHLGIVSPAKLNDVYSRCLAGLCVSMTNPSRVPFEMMAAGLPVVEAFRDNNLLDMPPQGVVLAELTPKAIKRAILDLVADGGFREQQRKAGLEFMAQRPAQLEQDQFCDHIFDILAGRPAKKQAAAPVKREAHQRPTVTPGTTEAPAYDLLTVDVWDTLLRRKCHPDEIKLFTARYLQFTRWAILKPAFVHAAILIQERRQCELSVGQQRRLKGLDDEYDSREVFKAWLSAVLAEIPTPAEMDKLVEELVAVELEQERRVIYADTEIKTVLDGIPARRRLFLSDFYMPATRVKELLQHAGMDAVVTDGFTSCDVSLNKRSGRFFKKVQQDLEVKPARHAHVGDNEYSDYFVPRSLGMAGVHFDHKAETERCERLKEEFVQRMDPKTPPPPEKGKRPVEVKLFCPKELRELTTLCNEDLTGLDTAAAMQRYGETMTPLYVGYALHVAEGAIRAGLDKLYFCTREGEFFAKVYAEVAKTNPFGVPFPEPVIIEVSRLATFAASLSRFDLVEFMRLWNLYSSQSLKSFFTSLDLDPAPVLSLVELNGLSLDEVLRHPWLDARVKKLFATEKFVKFLADGAAYKRALLLDYLKTKGIQGNEKQIGLVDIGWRGTIQDNLAWVLPRTQVRGWYFGLLPFLNVQPPNAIKSAFGPGRTGDPAPVVRLLEFVAPLEMLSNSESGSALRYERRDGTVVAQREVNPHEEEIFGKYTRHFQAGVLSRVATVGEIARHRALSSGDLRPLALELLSRIVHDPPAVVAEAYFSLNHNETFGTGAFDDKQRHRARIKAVTGLYETGVVEEFEKELRATTWPQGFARLCGIEYPFFDRDNRQPRELPMATRRLVRKIAAEALQHFQEQRWEDSRRSALRGLALDPWRLNLHYLLYRICLEQGRTKEALQRFRLIRLVYPKHAPSFNEFAVRSFGVGAKGNSVKLLEEIVEDRPEYRPALLNLCRVHLREHKPLKALALMDQAVETFGDDPAFLRFRAEAQMFAGYAVLADAGQVLGRLPKGMLQETPLLQRFKAETQNNELLQAKTPWIADEFKQFVQMVSDDEYIGVKRSVLAPSQPVTTGNTEFLTKPAATAGTAAAQPAALASIIVLAHNQLDHTRKCVESIVAHTRTPYEVILVDNGSTDGTAEYFAGLRKQHTHFKVITNRSNRGFAAGNNQGLAIAKGDVVVLLNNDTIVTPGWIEGMTAVLEGDKTIGLVGPVSNRVSGPQQVATTYQSDDGIVEFAKTWAGSNAGQTLTVKRLVGFCLLARRAVLEAIGGLDERFGSGNFEDDDFCLRAKFAGFGCRIARAVFIHHTGSQTFKGAGIDYHKSMMRNWEIFRSKWQLASDVQLEKGYPIPASAPSALSLKVPLASLNLTHKTEGGSHWIEATVAPKAAKVKIEVPSVARIGNLDEARAAFGRRDLAAAWKSAAGALSARPFHPEACLLLAEVALAAGDGASARQCAQLAADLAPKWKSPKQFLQKSLKGDTKPEWLVLPECVAQGKSAAKRLTICVVAKNEERFLGQCLASVKGLAQQIVVVDTGSTDRTVAIAKEHGAEVHTFTWCDDFSAARNAALEHVTGDWIFMLDADEELPAEQHAKLLTDLKAADAMAYRVPLVNIGEEAHGACYIPRLFRNTPGAFYYGRVHEQVFPSLIPSCKAWGLETKLGTSQLLHHGYTKELVRDRNKIERNLKLLRQAIEERPGDANLEMNLGLELVRSGELETGLTHYREAFRLMSAVPPVEVVPELREVLLTQLTAHLYKARAHEEIAAVLNSSLAKNGGLTASLHFALGLAQFELKQYRDTAEQMRQCLAKRKQHGFAPINTDILTAAPQHCLALSLARQNDVAGAEQAFEAGAAEPGADGLRIDYAKFLATQNRPVDALHRLNEVVQNDPQSQVAWRLGGEIALSKTEFLEFALDWTHTAVEQLPEDATIVAQRAEVLLLAQQAGAALPFWEKVCRGERPARALSALIICATLEGQTVEGPRSGTEEMAVSRAFVDWYRRLLAVQAQETIQNLNSRVDALRPVLPSAASLIDNIIVQAQTAEPSPVAA